jgi:mono/diheme cytochrome c family protein
VKHGIAGTAMPAAKLTDVEIRKVVAYVYTLRGAHHSK